MASNDDSDDNADTAKPLAIATAGDFESLDFQAPTDAVKYADCHRLESVFAAALRGAEASGNEPAARVFRVLAAICSFHFRPRDSAGPFGAQWVNGPLRSAIPDDFRGEQATVLLELMPSIRHPALRARIADTIWINDRKRGKAGSAAVEAYCDTIHLLIDGTYQANFDLELSVTFEQIDLLTRATDIASAMGRRKALPDRVRDCAENLYNVARTSGQPVPFERVAALRLQHGLASAIEIAGDAETLAREAALSNEYPMAVKAVWDLAAYAHERSGALAESRKCKLESVEQILLMRRQVSNGAAASWTQTAIQELRNIPETHARREELKKELLELQGKALDEFGVIKTPIDLTDAISSIEGAFDGLELSKMLLKFVFLDRPSKLVDLRQSAIEAAQQNPLSAMIGRSYFDGEGKLIHKAPGASLSGEPEEEWLKDQISSRRRLSRQITVAGAIDPARTIINASYNLSDRHFMAILDHSPLVPPSHRYTVALGFARFFQGDSVSAAHLLVPQLEHCVRHVLSAASQDTSKMLSDMIQEDRSLSALLEVHREAMERVFSVEVVNEIDLLFNYKGGPSLRHEFAHGKVTSGACFSPDVTYACWFIFHLACVPLWRAWEEYIGPAIEAEVG